jgi:hypothetical protein
MKMKIQMMATAQLQMKLSVVGHPKSIPELNARN